MTIRQRAVLSVSDKTGLAGLATELAALGVELIASGGTARAVREAGCAVTEVGDYTGAPEMLDGRVKTLHPKIHGGILACRGNAGHQADLQRTQTPPIDLVVVNCYPFAATIAQSGVTPEAAIEQIDIGGPTLLRAAAKNYRDVLVLCDPGDYARVVAHLQHGTVDAALRWELARKVFAHVAAYDAAISNWFERQAERGAQFPATITVQYRKVSDLRYGENPHQQAAWYQVPGAPSALQPALQGKALSYNNVLDAHAAIACVQELAGSPYAVAIVKHGNPCGVGVSSRSLVDAYQRALAGDPVSAFGGIVATTQPIDGATARVMAETFFEVICAPDFSAEARTIFAAKKNLRLMPYPAAADTGVAVRGVGGWCLMQSPDLEPAATAWRVVSQRTPSADERTALELAWKVAKHVHSNAIVFADATGTLGIGAGQMSRIDAVQLAGWKMTSAGLTAAQPRVAASDAFFPFRDGIDALAAAGVTAVVQPGGSVRDDEVIAAANAHHIAMCCTGVRHFRH